MSEKLSKYDLYLMGGLYSEVVFNTGLTVNTVLKNEDNKIQITINLITISNDQLYCC